jgi:thioredoxin 1
MRINMIRKLTKTEFQTKLSNNEFFIVDFYADWCTKCHELMPMVEEYAQNNPDIPIYKVNIDEEPELKEKARIKAIPMMIFYNNGRTREFLYGKADETSITRKATMARN